GRRAGHHAAAGQRGPSDTSIDCWSRTGGPLPPVVGNSGSALIMQHHRHPRRQQPLHHAVHLHRRGGRIFFEPPHQHTEHRAHKGSHHHRHQGWSVTVPGR